MKATDGQPLYPAYAATQTAKIPANKRSLLGFAVGLLAVVGLAGWSQWRANERQAEADAEEDANGIRLLLSKHPEWLEELNDQR